jgi:DNA-3-methyladenine glycosylase II
MKNSPCQELKLQVPSEFSFTENLKYLANAPGECLYHIKNERIYKAIATEQGVVVVEIQADQANIINIRFLDNTVPTNEAVRNEVVRYIREWFDLDTDLSTFYEAAKRDRLLRKAVETFHGLRNMGIPDLFEALCWGVIGQQINLPFAYTLKKRFVESFGRHVTCEGKTYWLFPSPQKIAALSTDDLTAIQISVKKSEYLIGIAQLIIEGALSKEMLLSAGGHKQAESLLIKIRGIGPWTANYVLMRCLRFPNAFPIDDVGLHNAIRFVMNKEKKPTKEEILQLSKGWTGWEAYATFYLWRFLY